jgi:hypothetical protein
MMITFAQEEPKNMAFLCYIMNFDLVKETSLKAYAAQLVIKRKRRHADV